MRMPSLPNSHALFNPELSHRSTGTCPSEWRRWWRDQSRADRTDWKSLLDDASAALTRLRAQHIARLSS
jgi:hypothetical protein